MLRIIVLFRIHCSFVLFGLVLAGSLASAQTVDPSSPSDLQSSSSLPETPVPQAKNEPGAVTLKNTPRNLLRDQKAIWTSPARLRVGDLKWLLPLAAATGVSLATDHKVMSSIVSQDQSFNQSNVNASNILIGGFIAAPVALYGFGHFKENEHAREAAILSGEALLDGVVVEQGLKLLAFRERPAADNARGLFFQGSAGVNSSFPSSHALLAWSEAAVIAEEYPSRWNQLGVYSLATGVSMTRVLGQAHFPTDVLIGSAAGWLVGHYVYRSHHKHSFGR